jgi:hypothetical protein
MTDAVQNKVVQTVSPALGRLQAAATQLEAGLHRIVQGDEPHRGEQAHSAFAAHGQGDRHCAVLGAETDSSIDQLALILQTYVCVF